MGLFYLLLAPKCSSEHVIMDFFFDLPTAKSRYNGVWLVVDRFLKMVKLIPITKMVTTKKTACLYMKHVYCNYGLPETIISDQDTHFNLNFWQTLWKLTSTTTHGCVKASTNG
jgi:hypothetical protein